MHKTILYVPLILLLGACAEQQSAFKAGDMPRFDDVDLAMGRSVWMGTCRNCHLLGVAGAPAVTNHPAWTPRIGKGKELLYDSALGGVRGEQGEIRMPPRGGNPRLSDEQVKRAVDYMVASVKYLHDTA